MFVAKTYTTEDVLTVIRAEVEKSSYRKLAAEKSLSLGQLADVLSGRTGISEKIASAFGFVREVTTEVKFRKAS
jgi:hypothetical protein